MCFSPDGRSLYDALGPDYSLLRFDPRVNVDGFVQAAERRGVPLAVVDVPMESAYAISIRTSLRWFVRTSISPGAATPSLPIRWR